MAAKRRNRRRRRGRASFPLRFLCLLIVIAAIVAALTMFFRIDMIVVEGTARYTDEQIIEAAVVVNRRYPDTLILTVTECAASAALPGAGGTWLVSDTGKILERTAQLPEGCVSVTGCELVEPSVGAQAAFSDEDSYKLDRLLTLLHAAEEKQLLSMIGSVDLSDGTAITLTYLDRFTVRMPWDADLGYKLENVRRVVDELEANETGVIDLMTDGKASFIPSK